jgi:hypothetical protein
LENVFQLSLWQIFSSLGDQFAPARAKNMQMMLFWLMMFVVGGASEGWKWQQKKNIGK